jgi:hypothetical protein
MESCNQCCGELVILGVLGSRVWGRCRQCGWEQSWKADAEILALDF